MPPSRRKPSMPARSETTWKLTARSARTTVKRTILAMSQPAMSTMRASPSRGSSTPICARNARTGSSITSKWSISVAFQQGVEPLQRDVDPVGTVVELVAQLVEHFLHLCELEQPAHVVERAVYAAADDAGGVSLQEGAPGG